MARLHSVMDKVARKCSVAPPRNWIGATEPRHVELVDFLDDTIKEIRKRRDWEDPVGADVEITGSTPGSVISNDCVYPPSSRKLCAHHARSACKL